MHNSPKPFYLKVVTGSLGVGAILSQKGSKGKCHSCVFFSQALSPLDKNYNLQDRELLTMKLRLDERRHLLEGTHYPVTILTTVMPQ